jgi:hypothetical protein
MGWTTTLVIFFLAAGLAGLARYKLAREKPVGVILFTPWTTIMIVCILVALLMLVHAVNMLGVETGPHMRGRMR